MNIRAAILDVLSALLYPLGAYWVTTALLAADTLSSSDTTTYRWAVVLLIAIGCGVIAAVVVAAAVRFGASVIAPALTTLSCLLPPFAFYGIVSTGGVSGNRQVLVQAIVFSLISIAFAWLGYAAARKRKPARVASNTTTRLTGASSGSAPEA